MFVYESEFWIYHVSRYFYYGKQHYATKKKSRYFWLIIRGKCNILQGVPTELTLLTNNLPSGYHREMQLTKEVFFLQLTIQRLSLHHRIYLESHSGKR